MKEELIQQRLRAKLWATEELGLKFKGISKSSKLYYEKQKAKQWAAENLNKGRSKKKQTTKRFGRNNQRKGCTVAPPRITISVSEQRQRAKKFAIDNYGESVLALPSTPPHSSSKKKISILSYYYSEFSDEVSSPKRVASLPSLNDDNNGADNSNTLDNSHRANKCRLMDEECTAYQHYSDRILLSENSNCYDIDLNNNRDASISMNVRNNKKNDDINREPQPLLRDIDCVMSNRNSMSECNDAGNGGPRNHADVDGLTSSNTADSNDQLPVKNSNEPRLCEEPMSRNMDTNLRGINDKTRRSGRLRRSIKLFSNIFKSLKWQ